MQFIVYVPVRMIGTVVDVSFHVFIDKQLIKLGEKIILIVAYLRSRFNPKSLGIKPGS